MKNKMYLRKYVVAICAMMLFCSHLLTAQNSQTRSASRNSQMPELNDWPKASKMAAEEMIKKYGQPDVSSEGLLVWMDKDHWKKIAVSREETEHNFPIDHTDMLEQSVSYKVPADKVDELVEFDGSVVVDRTQGLLSARCDMEANNLLALNLAHDVITEKRSVGEARQAYGDIIKEKMNGGDPEYMKKLTFDPQPRAADPGKNTTGLTKAEVMKKIKNKG